MHAQTYYTFRPCIYIYSTQWRLNDEDLKELLTDPRAVLLALTIKYLQLAPLSMAPKLFDLSL